MFLKSFERSQSIFPDSLSLALAVQDGSGIQQGMESERSISRQ